MAAPRVTIYTLSGCGPCLWARRMLERRGIRFTEIRGDDDPEFDRLLLERTGALTVPQIVIDDVPIGGADSLDRLERLGVLAELLTDNSFPIARVVRRFSMRALFRMYVSGGAGRPWSHRVQLVDEFGRVVESHRAASAEDAKLLAAALGRGVPTDFLETSLNGSGSAR
jgi:glutaredoxin 3